MYDKNKSTNAVPRDAKQIISRSFIREGKRGDTLIESATRSFGSRDLRFIIIAKTTNERYAITEGNETRLISVTRYSRFHDNITHSALSVCRERGR